MIKTNGVGVRRLLWTLFVVLLGTASAIYAPANVLAGVEDFRIQSFESDYYLERNELNTSLLTVSESIQAIFPEHDQNRGILRAIPKKYKGHTVSLQILSITDGNAKPWPYDTYTENDNLVLRIGDPNQYVRGQQTYRIVYRMKNVISFEEAHDEFYWDINGDQWAQDFGLVTARIHLPPEIKERLHNNYLCFAGSYGFNEKGECSITPQDDNGGVVLASTVASLGPRQTLTVVLGFDKGTFVLGPEIQAEKRRQQLIMIAGAVSFILPAAVTSTILYRRWHRDGKDPSGRGVIVPEYLPPKELNALTSSIVLNERLESKAVSALIVELAVKKYLHIYEVPKKGLLGKSDYELEVVKDPSGLNIDEMAALRMFFSDGVVMGSRIKLSSLKNKLHTDIQTLDENATRRLYEQGYFKNDPHKTRRRYVVTGLIMLVAAFIIGLAIVTIPFSLGLGLGGVLAILVSGKMPARSKLGVTTKEYLFGLKSYMKLAETERIKMLQSPDGAEKVSAITDATDSSTIQVKLFERLLPYAMLFGIEKDWAKQFQHLYVSPPDWYSGNWGTFSVVHLASSLGSFSGASASSFTAPSSSGSSGFGGGGFSGGGGGGGGGGGW